MAVEASAFVILAIFSSLVWGTPAAEYGTAYVRSIPPAAACRKENNSSSELLAAVGDSLWKNGSGCGKKFQLTCVGSNYEILNPCIDSSTVVLVVDRCMDSGITFGLPKEVYVEIGNPLAPSIIVDFKEV
ncbi:putative EG45-like domain containing protein 1 [Diospyros lotus]|uniref:putative EG45-like domain containing protein 1 n=1 Tax=Diospyros lotus TaxID=55363 RepID=UPI002258A5EC|nr:putative EG45-like domain containing protein 1 [Diospyros lotus]